MLDILYMYSQAHTQSSYGQVFLEAGKYLKKEGANVGFFNIARFAKGYTFSNYFAFECLQRQPAKLIISDHSSVFLSLLEQGLPREMVQLLQDDLDQVQLNEHRGRLQTNSPLYMPGSLELKVGFIERMREEKLPIPPSALREELEPAQWNYADLDVLLNDGKKNGLVLKEEGKHCARGIHVVMEETEIPTHPTVKIAQQLIHPHHDYPASLRLITFPGRIIGGFLIYHPRDLALSNKDGKRKIPLNISGTYYKDTFGLDSLLQANGVDDDLTVREDVLDVGLKTSLLPSRSLLRGIDMIFDGAGNPYVLEAQTGPGNLRGDTYPLLAGLDYKFPEHSVEVATYVIAHCLDRHLREN